MADIFLSYAREDTERAKVLAEAFMARGWTVWWDRTLVAGDRWPQVVERELAQAACVVVCWSKHAVESKWVSIEAAEGSEREILVPVLIESVKPPLAFRLYQTPSLVDWVLGRDSPEFSQVLQAVRRLTGIEGIAQPQTPQRPLHPDAEDADSQKAAPKPSRATVITPVADAVAKRPEPPPEPTPRTPARLFFSTLVSRFSLVRKPLRTQRRAEEDAAQEMYRAVIRAGMQRLAERKKKEESAERFRGERDREAREAARKAGKRRGGATPVDRSRLFRLRFALLVQGICVTTGAIFAEFCRRHKLEPPEGLILGFFTLALLAAGLVVFLLCLRTAAALQGAIQGLALPFSWIVAVAALWPSESTTEAIGLGSTLLLLHVLFVVQAIGPTAAEQRTPPAA